MTQYILDLTDAQDKALAYVASSQQEWIEGVVYERCRLAIEEIVKLEIDRKLAAGEPISGTKEEIVMAAQVKSAAQRHAEAIAQFNGSEG